MSSRHSLINMATPQTHADGRHHEHHQRRRFGYAGIRAGARTATARFAEVGSRSIIPVLQTISFAPHDIVCSIDRAVVVIVAEKRRTDKRRAGIKFEQVGCAALKNDYQSAAATST